MKGITITCLLMVITFVNVSVALWQNNPFCDDGYRELDGTPVCTKCRNYYALDESFKPPRCQKCDINSGCHFCTNLTRCERCLYTNHGPDTNGVGTCSPCPVGCSLCPQDCNICERCSPGYVKSGAQCLSCPNHCAACDLKSYCQMCFRGYYKNAFGICDPCGANCDLCPGGPSACTTCSGGYYLLPDKSCTQCGVLNCRTCVDSVSCQTCNPGYYTKDTKSCTECPLHCRICNNTGDCISCKYGGLLPDGTCPCNVSHCASCPTDGNICVACKSGYIVKENQCSACSVFNCASCPTDGTLCEACRDGYMLDGQQCTPCSDGCKTCNKIGCSNCKTGYKRTDARTCVRISNSR